MKIDPSTVTTPVVLVLASEAHTDPRTVRKWLAGEATRPSLSERIAAAALARGILPPTPASATLGSSLY